MSVLQTEPFNEDKTGLSNQNLQLYTLDQRSYQPGLDECKASNVLYTDMDVDFKIEDHDSKLKGYMGCNSRKLNEVN